MFCDRRDFSSVSTTDHLQAETSALFIQYSYHGGVGMARNGYDDIDTDRQKNVHTTHE